MPSKYAKCQIRMMELLKENNLLDMAVAGKLPPHVLKAAKEAAIAELGLPKGESGDIVNCSPEEHLEAERELDEYLKHYRLDKAMRAIVTGKAPRVFRKGSKYTVRRGFFKDRLVTYKGTDKEVWGVEWLDNPGNPACEKYIFRAQRDGLNVNKTALVFNLKDENRDIILQSQEIGLEVS